MSHARQMGWLAAVAVSAAGIWHLAQTDRLRATDRTGGQVSLRSPATSDAILLARIEALLRASADAPSEFPGRWRALLAQTPPREIERSLDILIGTKLSPSDLERTAMLLTGLARVWPESALTRAARLGEAADELVVRLVRQSESSLVCAWLLRPENADWHAALAEILVSEWIHAAPATAAKLIVGLPEGATRSDSLGRLMQSWSGSDFPGALRWAQNLNQGSLRSQALQHLVPRWTTTDPAGALAYAQSSDADERLLISVATQWAGHEPALAAEWAKGFAAQRRGTAMLASVASRWAETAPAEAARFAASVEAEDARRESMVSVVSAWARQDPGAAARWVDGFPAGGLKELAAEQVLFAWAQRDLTGAARWVADMDASGEVRDRALSSLIGSMVDQYPAVALDLAGEISDAGLRRARLENIARRWLAADRDSAMDGLIHSAMGEEVVTNVLLQSVKLRERNQ